MAVPKQRTSRANSRRSQWKARRPEPVPIVVDGGSPSTTRARSSSFPPAGRLCHGRCEGPSPGDRDGTREPNPDAPVRDAGVTTPALYMHTSQYANIAPRGQAVTTKTVLGAFCPLVRVSGTDKEAYMSTSTAHRTHTDHAHEHGPGCGHVAFRHEDHVDYAHDGHLHRAHEGHIDECETGEHVPHEGHQHQHQVDCGHVAIPHEGHVDYVHDGHRHVQHGDHWDEH
jgi:hypothetical protein